MKSRKWMFAFLVILLGSALSAETPLTDILLIDTVKLKGEGSYKIISGLKCKRCDEGRRIYIRPNPFKKQKIDSFDYPGEIRDYLTGKKIQTIEVYYGYCLSKEYQSLVWKFKNINSTDFQIVDFKNKMPIRMETLKNQKKPIIIKGRECKEVPGINRDSQP